MYEAGIQREIHVEKRTCLILEWQGFRCYKLFDDAMNGFPDRTIIAPNGNVCFIEFKHPNGRGKLSYLQKQRIEELERCNAKIGVHIDVEEAVMWAYEATGYDLPTDEDTTYGFRMTRKEMQKMFDKAKYHA